MTITATGGSSPSGAAATAVLEISGVTAGLTGASFAFRGNVFELSTPTAADIGNRLSRPVSGTDISDLLGMGPDSTPVYLQGHSQETITEAVAEMLGLSTGSTPVALMIDDDVLASLTLDNGRDVRTALGAFAQAGDYVFGLIDHSDDALVTGDTTSHVARAFAAGQDKVEPVYSKPGERPDIGLLALMSSQNLNNPASIITPHLKTLNGVEPTNITETQRAELERKRTNVYTTVGGLPSLVGGFTGQGRIVARCGVVAAVAEERNGAQHLQRAEGVPPVQHADPPGRSCTGHADRGAIGRHPDRRPGQRVRAAGHHRDDRESGIRWDPGRRSPVVVRTAVGAVGPRPGEPRRPVQDVDRPGRRHSQGLRGHRSVRLIGGPSCN